MNTQNISWGKIIKGAAIAAGAVAAIAFFPDATAAVGDSLKSVVSAVFGGLGDVGSWIASQVSRVAGFIAANPTTSILTAAGAGALAGSAISPVEDRKAVEFENESFALREDMRRMQTLMQARMAATGYQPAMAMAGRPR